MSVLLKDVVGFSQSSNLSAHEKTHFLMNGSNINDTNNQDTKETTTKKKKYFRVVHPNDCEEVPIRKKPIVILDQQVYNQEKEREMKERQRIEEEKKKKEKENLKELKEKRKNRRKKK